MSDKDDKDPELEEREEPNQTSNEEISTGNTNEEVPTEVEDEVANSGSSSSGSDQPDEVGSDDGKSDECDRTESADDGLSDGGASTSSSGSEKGQKKKSNRCHVCRKKVGLTGFVCRCGGLFCSIHRYSDKHDCSFNYILEGQAEIRRNNPKIVAQKIKKI